MDDDAPPRRGAPSGEAGVTRRLTVARLVRPGDKLVRENATDLTVLEITRVTKTITRPQVYLVMKLRHWTGAESESSYQPDGTIEIDRPDPP